MFLRFGNHEVKLELRMVKSSSLAVCGEQVKWFSSE